MTFGHLSVDKKYDLVEYSFRTLSIEGSNANYLVLHKILSNGGHFRYGTVPPNVGRLVTLLYEELIAYLYKK